MKLFKLIASRAGQVLFDDRVEADSPREAREQIKALMGLNSLTGVVYAITEIPIDLIQSIVDARLVEALQRLNGGQAPATVEQMLRPIASEAVREQLASLREARITPDDPPPPPQRFDAFTPAVDQIIGTPTSTPPKPRGKLTSMTTSGTLVDWKAVKRLYRRTGSIKQTAAQFKLSVNSVKARIRREGWTHE
jgi:hypothetical protein